METLNEVVCKYLKENGVTLKHFSKYINVEYTSCSKWIHGKKELPNEKLKKVHEFLNGNSIKRISEILKE